MINSLTHRGDGQATGGADFGDHLLKTAHVEVFWGEGAVKESTSLTMLLTNQKKIDETVTTLQATLQATKPKPSKKKKPRRKKNKGKPPPQQGGQ